MRGELGPGRTDGVAARGFLVVYVRMRHENHGRSSAQSAELHAHSSHYLDRATQNQKQGLQRSLSPQRVLIDSLINSNSSPHYSTMSSLLEQAFGTTKLNLYVDVLKVSKDCTLARLRKAYYQQALKYHPDKNPDEDAKLKFQAISWAYQLLKNPEKRADYDKDGVIPHDDDNDADDGEENHWKNYFDLIFGKVSTQDIDQFAMKYKMSEEEEQDVLKHYEKFKGNLLKMLDYVMLSEERDVQRWVEDYIKPAIETRKVKDYSETLNKTVKQVQKKIDTENEKLQDTDETETEGSDENTGEHTKMATRKKPPPRKAKPTKAKKAKCSQQDLIAAIRNKNGSNPLAAIGARYGVSMDEEDPLDDVAFAKLQSKHIKK
jgi:DnaJ family protein C protein 9